MYLSTARTESLSVVSGQKKILKSAGGDQIPFRQLVRSSNYIIRNRLLIASSGDNVEKSKALKSELGWEDGFLRLNLKNTVWLGRPDLVSTRPKDEGREFTKAVSLGVVSKARGKNVVFRSGAGVKCSRWFPLIEHLVRNAETRLRLDSGGWVFTARWSTRGRPAFDPSDNCLFALPQANSAREGRAPLSTKLFPTVGVLKFILAKSASFGFCDNWLGKGVLEMTGDEWEKVSTFEEGLLPASGPLFDRCNVAKWPKETRGLSELVLISYLGEH